MSVSLSASSLQAREDTERTRRARLTVAEERSVLLALVGGEWRQDLSDYFSSTQPLPELWLWADAEDLAVKFKEHNAPCLQRTLTASRLGLSHLSSPSHTQSWRHNIWIQFITRNGPSQLNTKITFRCEGLLLQSYVQTVITH